MNKSVFGITLTLTLVVTKPYGMELVSDRMWWSGMGKARPIHVYSDNSMTAMCLQRWCGYTALRLTHVMYVINERLVGCASINKRNEEVWNSDRNGFGWMPAILAQQITLSKI